MEQERRGGSKWGKTNGEEERMFRFHSSSLEPAPAQRGRERQIEREGVGGREGKERAKSRSGWLSHSESGGDSQGQ